MQCVWPTRWNYNILSNTTVLLRRVSEYLSRATKLITQASMRGGIIEHNCIDAEHCGRCRGRFTIILSLPSPLPLLRSCLHNTIRRQRLVQGYPPGGDGRRRQRCWRAQHDHVSQAAGHSPAEFSGSGNVSHDVGYPSIWVTIHAIIALPLFLRVSPNREYRYVERGRQQYMRRRESTTNTRHDAGILSIFCVSNCNSFS